MVSGTILITGGAGYIGSHTVRHLNQMGREVVVIDNLSYGHREAIPSSVTFVDGDIADTKLLRSLFSEIPIFCSDSLRGLRLCRSISQ